MALSRLIRLLLLVSTIALAVAGTCTTTPGKCSAFRKGDFVAINGRPAKVVEISPSKGALVIRKVHVVGIDVFTNKQIDDTCTAAHRIEHVTVDKDEYTLVDITRKGYASLLKADGDVKDIPLPGGELGADIRAAFNRDSQVKVIVIAACDEEAIVSYREAI